MGLARGRWESLSALQVGHLLSISTLSFELTLIHNNNVPVHNKQWHNMGHIIWVTTIGRLYVIGLSFNARSGQ